MKLYQLLKKRKQINDFFNNFPDNDDGYSNNAQKIINISTKNFQFAFWR